MRTSNALLVNGARLRKTRMHTCNALIVALVVMVHAAGAQDAALLRGEGGLLKVLDRVDAVLDKEMDLLAADEDNVKNVDDNKVDNQLALAHQHRMRGFSDVVASLASLPLMAKKWIKGHQCIWFALKCTVAVVSLAVPGLAPAMLATLIGIKVVDTLVDWTDTYTKSKENWRKFDQAAEKGIITGAMVQQCKTKDATGAALQAVVGAFWNWCSVVLPLEPVEAFLGVGDANTFVENAEHFKKAVGEAFDNAATTAEKFKLEKAFAQGAGSELTQQLENKAKGVIQEEATLIVLSCEDVLNDATQAAAAQETEEAWYEIELQDIYPSAAAEEKVPMMDNPMNEAVQAAEEQVVKKVEAKSIFQKFKKQVLDWTRDARKKLVRKVPNTCPFLLTNNGPDAQKAATEDEIQLVDAERVAPEP